MIHACARTSSAVILVSGLTSNIWVIRSVAECDISSQKGELNSKCPSITLSNNSSVLLVSL